jgi:acyl carrier protein
LVSVQGRAASLSPALTLAEVGADSLALARLSAAIKEQLHRDIPMAQLVKLTLESLQGLLYGGLSLRDALAASSAIDWQAEAERAVAEVPRSTAATTAPTNTTSSSSTAVPCVLLTGCTGLSWARSCFAACWTTTNAPMCIVWFVARAPMRVSLDASPTQ